MTEPIATLGARCLALHNLYIQLTGKAIPYQIFPWEAWVVADPRSDKPEYTEADLRLVVAFIKRRIKEGKRWDSSLRFSNLIVNLDRFAEDKADAEQEARQRKAMPAMNPGRAEALRATGRSDQQSYQQPGARRVDEIVRKCLDQMRKDCA